MTFLRDRGLAGPSAAWVLSATAFMGVLGKLGFGGLLDRFGQRAIILLCFALQALGVGLLIAPTTTAMLTAFVVVYGFAMGGNATLWATVVAACFGRLHYGAIAGWMTPFIVFFQALAIPLTGAVRDAVGSYEPAFAAIIALTLAAVACIAGLDPHERPRPVASP
ncbi:MAG: MFS transporter [Candidatus Binatia bacterium]